MNWNDIRKYTKFKENLPSRLEFVWELVTLLRRKLLLYRRGKSFTSMHHKMGLLSFFLRKVYPFHKREVVRKDLVELPKTTSAVCS